MVSSGIHNRSAFRTTIGAPGRLATRLQPNHPTDDPAGVALSVLDGLLMGAGDAVVGINPASDAPQQCADLIRLLDDLRTAYDIPVQSCVLTHVTTTLGLMDAGVPVDLVFQSIAGTQGANSAFGVTLPMLAEAAAAGRELGRGTVGDNAMYFETGQGTPLSSGPTWALVAGRSTSRPSSAGRTPSHGPSTRCWSTPWSVSSAPNTSMTA